MKNIIKFIIGGWGYGTIEVLWRGYTHWSMMITGGLTFISLGKLRKNMKNESFVKKAISGGIVITITEAIVGFVCNKVYKMNVWDYSKEKFSLGGQICPKYLLLWCLLSIPTMFLSEKLD